MRDDSELDSDVEFDNDNDRRDCNRGQSPKGWIFKFESECPYVRWLDGRKGLFRLAL